MRALIYALLLVMVSGIGCRKLVRDNPPNPLAFYIVSNEKIDGGRFIDTPDLPKLGYIAAKPDLVITELESVMFDTNAVGDTVITDENGKRTVIPSKSHAAIFIKFRPVDQKQFASLTERAVGKRLLLMLGDSPLAAPNVMMPIDSPSFMITAGSDIDEKKVTDELKKLVQ